MIRAGWKQRPLSHSPREASSSMNPKLKQECAACTSEVTVPELPVSLQQLHKYWPGRPSLAIPSCLRSWGLLEAYIQAPSEPPRAQYLPLHHYAL